MKISIVRDVKTPTRAHTYDAGIDFFIPNDLGWESRVIWPGTHYLLDSGIKADVLPGTALICMEKSGIATKKGLIIGAKVVDSGYQGTIHIHLMNPTNKEVSIEAGEKIAQFVLIPVICEPIEVVDIDRLYKGKSERLTGGFGSTGNK